MYFGRKYVETAPNCSYELAIFLKYHMPLMEKYTQKNIQLINPKFS